MQVPKKTIIAVGIIMVLAAGVIYIYTLRKPSGSGKGVAADASTVSDPEIKALFDETKPESAYQETSIDKIDADFSDQKITAEQFALLEIAAIYSPDKLPEKYRGAPDTDKDHAFLYGVIYDNWSSFSDDAKTALTPFLLPPTDPKSYFNDDTKADEEQNILQKVFGATKAQAAGDVKLSVDSKTDVVYKDTASDQVKQHAEWMKAAAAIAIPKFKQLLSIDPKYIFIYPTSAAKVGTSYGDSEFIPLANGICHVRVKDNLNLIETNATTAHEIFHCFQYFYGFKYESAMKWFMEATATWSEDYVFPSQQTEHEYDDDFLDHMPWDLVGTKSHRQYGSYLWFFYLSQKYSPEHVAYVFQLIKENGSNPQRALELLPDYPDLFKESAFWDWNYKPYQYFQDIPSFPNIHPNGESRKGTVIKNTGDYPAQVDIGKGSAKYFIYGFSGDKVKLVTFNLKELTQDQNPNVGVQAVYKINGVWYYEDWSSQTERSFCRDMDGENIDGLVMIVSNSDLKLKLSKGFNLKVDNKCSPGWRGTIRVNWSMKQLTGASTIDIDNGSYTINEELKYNSEHDVLEIAKANFSAKYYGEHKYIAPRADFCTLWEINETNQYGAGNYDYTHRAEDAVSVRFTGETVTHPGRIGGVYGLGFGIPPDPSGDPNAKPFKTTSYSSIKKQNCTFILSLPNEAGVSNDVSHSEDPNFDYTPYGVTVQVDPDQKRIFGSDKFEINPGVFGTVQWDYQKIE